MIDFATSIVNNKLFITATFDGKVERFAVSLSAGSHMSGDASAISFVAKAYLIKRFQQVVQKILRKVVHDAYSARP